MEPAADRQATPDRRERGPADRPPILRDKAMNQPANSPSNLAIHPLAGALGAELSGVNLGAGLTDDQVAKIEDALVEHQVIFFRDQILDLPGLEQLGRRFEALQIHPF